MLTLGDASLNDCLHGANNSTEYNDLLPEAHNAIESIIAYME